VTPVNWATSGGVKIERAKEHIVNLNAEITTFFEGNAYTIVREYDSQTGELVVRARIPMEPPLRWGAVAGDAVHNLRSTLDLLWRQANHPSAHWMTTSENFPIYSCADKLDAELARAVKSRRKTAMNILKKIESYEGGNKLLCLLNSVDQIDKHRLLIPAYNSTDLTRIMPDLSVEPLPGQFFPPREIQRMTPLCPIHDGTELLRVPANLGEMNVQFQFQFSIAFGEVGIVHGKDIVATLGQLADVVEGIAETIRIAGLIR